MQIETSDICAKVHVVADFVPNGEKRGLQTMDIVSLSRKVTELKQRGLTETEIGVIINVHQCNVSRVYALRTLEQSIASLFSGSRATLSALKEIASWPNDVQRRALTELVKMRAKYGDRTLSRPPVAALMARLARDLDRAPFPTRACRACAKRTGAQADLFGTVAPNALGRCLDAACWSRCCNAVAARAARWPKDKDFSESSRRMKENNKRKPKK